MGTLQLLPVTLLQEGVDVPTEVDEYHDKHWQEIHHEGEQHQSYWHIDYLLRSYPFHQYYD